MILNGQDSPHFSKRHGLIGPGDQRVGRLNVFETTESSLERRDSVGEWITDRPISFERFAA